MSDDHTDSAHLVTPAERDDDSAPIEGFPLSAMQRSIWLDDRLHPGSIRFHISTAVEVFAEMDEQSAYAAFESVTRDHAALRTTFHDVDGSPCQRVHETMEPDLRFLDATRWGDERLEAELEHAHRGAFDLATGPPVRFVVFRRDTAEHIVVITIHHVVADMWSQALLGHAVITAFLRASPHHTVSDVRTRRGADRSWTYQDFVEDEVATIDSVGAIESMSYWRDLFDAWTPLELPADRSDPDRPSGVGGVITRTLDPALTARIEAFARAHDVSFRSILLSAFQTVLARTSGVADVTVAEVKANRNLRSARTIGCFVNQVPRRLAFDRDTTCAQGVRAIEDQTRSSRSHESWPFECLLHQLRPGHGTEPFFQAAFAWQKTTQLVDEQLTTNLALGRTADTIEHEGLRLRPVAMPMRSAPFPITLLAGTAGDRVHLTFEFQVERFDRSSIEALDRRLEAVLLATVDRPDTAIVDVDLVTPEERSRWADERERSHRPFDESVTALHLVVDRIAATPHAVALRFGDESITYAELSRRARLLASRLHDAGVRPGEFIGLYQRRSPDLVASILATWMVGAAYVPLDPEFPPQRLAMMMADADVGVVVANGDLWSGFRDAVGPGSDATIRDGLNIVDLDSPDETVTDERREPANITGTDAAYAAFTSGSTGRPKGIVAEHRNVANFAHAMLRRPGMTADDRVLASTTLSFDPSVLELIVPLTIGATIELIDRSTLLDPARLATVLDRVTIAQATPTSWKMLIDDGWVGNPDLTVLCGGESLTPTLSRQLSSRCRDLWNLYGPTETTVWSSVGRIDPSSDHISIGEPIDNALFVVLDESQRRCPDGVAGELWIGGAGVARGYLGRDDLTASRFVEDPAGEGLDRLYRTGDVVRRIVNHGIEFVGRVDHQVKIRGHRIELGEIESTLATHPDIAQAVVTTYTPTNDPTDTRLAAYVTTTRAGVADDEVRTHAATTLPAHMIPNAIIQLDHFPLTANKKVDRTRLPQPDISSLATAHDPPHPGLEARIAAVWQNVLDVDDIGRHDDFFQLGGHSLLALKAFGRLSRENPHGVPLSVMFQAPTVASLAAALSRGRPDRGWTSLVEIHPGGDRAPFFYVTPFIVGVLAFSHLGRHFGVDQPIYCLQPQGLERSAPVHTTVEAMATHYLDEIRQVQPVGPYHLGGHCAGSIVAYEMARQLQAAGERVQVLVLVDSPPPGTEGAAHHRRRTPRDLLGRVVHYARTGRLLDSLRWVVVTAVDQVWASTSGNPLSNRTALVRLLHARAHARYETTPIDGDATFIRSEEWSLRSDKDWHLDWADLFGGDLQVTMIPGTHAGLVENVNSEALSKAILESIADARGEDSVSTHSAADRAPSRMENSIERPPLVSVVIPTFNRRDRLNRVLEALAAQSYPSDLIEIIVVSDGSTDDTDEYLASGRTPVPVRARRQSNAGPAVARNNGVAHSTGDIVLFLDDDVIPTPELVSRHVDSHRRSSQDDLVVIGPMLTPPDHPMSAWVRWEQAMLDRQYEAMRRGRWTATARQFYTGNASMSRNLFQRSGGFDGSFRRAEDVELAYRLERDGVDFEMNLDAVGFHYAIRSFESWIAIASAYGRANVVFGREHGRGDLFRTIARDHRRRHPVNRLVSGLAVRSERFAGFASTWLGRLAHLADERHRERISRYALSGVYNIAYSRGVAAELGGARQFGRFLRRHHPLLKPSTWFRSG